jgi:molecular chaperone GrpE
MQNRKQTPSEDNVSQDAEVDVIDTEQHNGSTTDGAEPQVAPQTPADDYKDQWLRAVADYKNYKRRVEVEREELKRTANASLMLKMLPVVDDLERAFESVPADVVQTAWWEGTRMIIQKMATLLESEGVVAMDVMGQPFDPMLHHAVSYEETDGDDDAVVSVLQKGYAMHEKVLRPAMVKVGKKS